MIGNCLLEVWVVKHGKAYDVFELPPRLSADERKALARELKKYRYVVATEPWEGAWVIGQDGAGKTVKSKDAPEVQKKFEDMPKARRWLSAR